MSERRTVSLAWPEYTFLILLLCAIAGGIYNAAFSLERIADQMEAGK